VTRSGEGTGWRGRGARGIIGMLVMALALAGSAREGSAQGLADFDYENLQLRGIGFYAGYILPSTVEPTVSFGGRMDLGYLGPGLRIMPGFTYWSSKYRREEVLRLENQLEELIIREQPPGTPVPDVNLGTIRWSDMVLNLDGHFVWSVPFNGLTYAGVGVAAHILNGSGEAIEGTFVEDLLDRVAVGANIHGGAEMILSDELRVFGEARAELVENIQYLEFRAGFQIMFDGAAPGELRLRRGR
jgi:hypothetical protein